MSRGPRSAASTGAAALLLDAGLAALIALGAVSEMAGHQRLGCLLQALAVVALVARWGSERQSAGDEFQPLNHLVTLRILAFASVLVAVVLPLRTPTEAVFSALAAAVLAAGAIVEPVLAKLAAVRVPVAVGLPGVPPPVPERDYVDAHLAAQVVGLLAGLVIAVTYAPAWIWLVVALASLVPAALLVLDTTWRAARARLILRSLKRAVAAYRPDLVLHTSHSGGVTHQVMMWLPYLQRTGLNVLVVARNNTAARALSRVTDCPVVEAPTAVDLDHVIAPSVRAIFYPNARQGNGTTVKRFREVRHVFLGHGDSDKATSYAPSHAMYDEIFCAGPAAARRYGAHGVHIAAEKFRFVGRPQVEDVAAATRPMAGIDDPVVLYAPTWRGYTRETNLSSLPAGPRIVAGLLRHNATVIFRPHPSSLASPSDRVHIAAIHALLAADRTQTGRPHRFGDAASEELDAIGCMNAADAMVSDVSGVASDFLFSNKPLAMVSVTVTPEAFRAEFPLTRGAYVLQGDLANLDEALADFLGGDSLSTTRSEIRSDYLGDFPAEGYASVFVDAARRAASTPVSGTGPVDSPTPAVISPVAPSVPPAGLRPRLGAVRKALDPLWPLHQIDRFDYAAVVCGLAALATALCGGSDPVVLALLLLAAVVGFVPVLALAARRRQVFRLNARGAAGRAVGGLTVVAIWPADHGWHLWLVVFGLVVPAVAAVEATIGRIWSARQSASRNLPTLRRPAPGPSRGWPAVGGLLVMVAAVSPVPTWVPAALAVGLLSGTIWIAVSAVRRADHLEKAETKLRRAVAAYAPAFVVYVGTRPGADSGLPAWLPYLAELDRRFVIITHQAATMAEIDQQCRRHQLKVPILWRSTARSLEGTVSPSMSTVFYPADSLVGKRMVALRNLTHVWLNHREAETGESVSPVAAMYDKVFVPGRAAIDRFARHRVLIPEENFAIAGRPQVSEIAVATQHLADIERPTFMYAPTWSAPGSARHSSLDQGLEIVSALIAGGARVLFRPNRFYARYPERRAQVQAIGDLLAEDRKATGTKHLFGPAAEQKLSLTACLNTSDALICDGAGTLYDYLHSTKPFAVISDGSTPAELTEALPMMAGAYLVDSDLGNLAAVLTDMRGPDSQAGERDRVRTYYLGPFPAAYYAQGFVRAAREVIDAGVRPQSVMVVSSPESEAID